MREGFFLAILVIFLATGCARVKVTRTNDGDYEEGVRFYRSEPYIWVSPEKDKENKDIWKCQVIYLPNKRQEYVAKVSGFLGTADANLTLENGWNLTNYGEKRDSKIPETINAVAGLIGAVSKFGPLEIPADQGKKLLPEGVGLYRLVFDEPDPDNKDKDKWVGKTGSLKRIEYIDLTKK